VDVATSVDAFQQVFVEFVAALEAEADEAHLNFGDDFKARVFEAERFELLGKAAVGADMGLE
jgi:hypothetical protein